MSIRAINNIEVQPIPKSTQITAQMNFFYILALLQGRSSTLSMGMQEEREKDVRAAKIIEGITDLVKRHELNDAAGLDKMLADIEKMKAIFAGESTHTDRALAKLDSMSTNIEALKGKLAEVKERYEEAIQEYNEEVNELNRLNKKLKGVKDELNKYSWVPFYGGKLAVEALVLQGRVQSAAKRVEGKMEKIAAVEQEVVAVLKKVDAAMSPMAELKIEAQKLSYEAKSAIAALQATISSALNAQRIIKGGI
ncbi:MAG: hypothetical protein COT84_00475 [Chlamydiae bacterium CG10_big_fil_rev_8_21_14_0_10_35_9]|nr:MAG: hypothetical protein COT84_00475 [Chlamydiae bacterium CG10_big_fil_rev_8_21_14_0_10_35_9]